MPDFMLRKHVIVASAPNDYLVILKLEDGYELKVGHISEQTGAGMDKFWAWAGPGGIGRSPTLEDAATAFREKWVEPDVSALRYQQEWTDAKYILFDAGYKNQIARGEILCPCGVKFGPDDHPTLMAHIEHISSVSV